jgi:hypothetical protein
MTRSEYRTEIASIAEEIQDEIRRNGGDVQDRVHEYCDGHQWVIYTEYNYDVLANSANSECGVDDGLVDANAAIKEGGLGRLTAQLACCAMMQDVFEELGSWEGPKDDEAEEAAEVTA